MSFIKNWLRPEILQLDAYHVSKADGLIKLDAMESPFTMPDSARQQLLDAYAGVCLSRYPDSESSALKQQIKQTMAIPESLSVLLGNGSDELIQILALACCEGDTIISFEPSFVMYQMVAKFTRLKHVSVPLTDEFDIDLAQTLAVINEQKPTLIFIDYPNNPSGRLFNKESIIQIIKQTDALVVLDEAYYIYTNESFVSEVERYPNLVVLRTLSKLGFAGLRLGCLIGSNETVAELNKLRMPYNISTLTQVSAHCLLQHDYFKQNAQTVMTERHYLSQALSDISGVEAVPSQANFILFKVCDADAVFAFIKNKGILIKNLNAVLTGYLRVTVGTRRENDLFIEGLKSYYG